jgi:hypothetical protein
VTPLEEVRTTGRIGHEGARLLYRLVYSVAVDRNIPAPQGHENWGRAAIEETAHDFLSGSAGMERLVTIANQSNDDDSFRRQLAAAVLNHLRTGGRTTDVGKLVIRLNEILKTTPAFEKIRNGRSNYWAITNGPTDVSNVALSDLEPELRTMEVIRPKWTSETRDAPLADRSTLIDMLTRVLTRAGGSLTSRDLAEVIAARVDIRRVPIAYELDDPDEHFEPAAPDHAGSATVDSSQAHDFFNTLTDRERIILTNPDKTARELAPLLGLKHAQTAVVRQRLFDRLRNEVAESEDPEAVVEDLCDLCEEWVADWTDHEGATS